MKAAAISVKRSMRKNGTERREHADNKWVLSGRGERKRWSQVPLQE